MSAVEHAPVPLYPNPETEREVSNALLPANSPTARQMLYTRCLEQSPDSPMLGVLEEMLEVQGDHDELAWLRWQRDYARSRLATKQGTELPPDIQKHKPLIELGPEDDFDEIGAINIAGAPGAGKDTVGAFILKYLGRDPSDNLSSGNLLRETQTEMAAMQAGGLAPGAAVLELLKSRLLNHQVEAPVQDASTPKRINPDRVLLNGFPREKGQVGEVDGLLGHEAARRLVQVVLEVDPEVSEHRILGVRAKQAGGEARADDNAITFKKRLNTHVEQTVPTINTMAERYDTLRVDANQELEYVLADIINGLRRVGRERRERQLATIVQQEASLVNGATAPRVEMPSSESLSTLKEQPRSRWRLPKSIKAILRWLRPEPQPA